MLLFCFVVVIVHAWIFCLCFSQKQSANQAKKIQGNVVLLNWKAHAKLQALLKEKNFTWKSHLRPSCTKPFNCRVSTRQELSMMGCFFFCFSTFVLVYPRVSDQCSHLCFVLRFKLKYLTWVGEVISHEGRFRHYPKKHCQQLYHCGILRRMYESRLFLQLM